MSKKKWKTESKKDWLIAFVFVALIVYGISMYFTGRLNALLMGITNPRLTELNQPSGYGNAAVTFLIMGIITGAALAVKKQPCKKILPVVIAGAAACGVCIGAYFIHCELIVSVSESMNPGSVWISGSNLKNNGFSGNFSEEDENMAKLAELCASLKELPKGEQKKLREGFTYNYDDEITVWISYPEKYFHSYSLILRIQDDKIFMLRDNGREIIFFEDNGLIKAVMSFI